MGKIRVKFLSRDAPRIPARQLPAGTRSWGRCRFLFDRDARDYDWLVVYDDLPAREGAKRSTAKEILACPREHTILVTTEPSSIKAYGDAYTAQFGCVITSQEPWALPHPDRIYSQPGLRWFYGDGSNQLLPFEQLSAMPPPRKTRTISMVWSEKREWYTNHRARNVFMRKIRDALQDLDVFGRNTRRPLDDKAAALDPYHYHIAIENHVSRHHWTEKLADPFLGYCLPIYHGCTNVEDYFPEESLIRIDIGDFPSALRRIREAIANQEYEKRLPYIKQARRLVLEKHNLFAILAREVEKRHDPARRETGDILYSRYALRRTYPLLLPRQVYEKTRNRLRANLQRITTS